MLYCPKCATQNMDNARFCRTCGSDISLVPAALTGRIPQAPVVVDEDDSRRMRRRKRKESKPPTYEKAFENIGVGIAFMIISIVVALYVPSGKFWWFWMLIPTFACMGEGIGHLVRLRGGLPAAPSAVNPAELPPSQARAVVVGELSTRATSEIMPPPPSVTEGTTRHLGAEAPERK